MRWKVQDNRANHYESPTKAKCWYDFCCSNNDDKSTLRCLKMRWSGEVIEWNIFRKQLPHTWFHGARCHSCYELNSEVQSISFTCRHDSRQSIDLIRQWGALRGGHEWILLNIPDTITQIDRIIRFSGRPEEGAKCSNNRRGIDFL